MRRKIYGQSRIEICPFCEKRALLKNKQGVPVCKDHKNKELNLKCICGEWLEVRSGKWGAYFFCFNCGNISFRKGIEMNSYRLEAEQEKKEQEKVNKETTVRSDELDF